MGVPGLSSLPTLMFEKPKIVSPVVEEQPREIDGQLVPIDTRGANPNGEEFDNLYLDMNGIVHPCSHPEDRPAPKDEEEMMMAIFKYTDRVVNMVRPRKLLLIAIDGVAPRAKMNQQRSRRFRSAQEAKEKAEDKLTLLKMLKSQGSQPEEPEAKKAWDSNEITPGTPFMDVLAASLRYWIAYKLNVDPAWAQMKIIISDSTVPGEGEHKIMEFIRSQRASPEYDPNTKHVMYGLDADLIMLGLGTHEPHFRVLREDVFAQDSKPRVCHMCNQAGHEARECTGAVKVKVGKFDEKNSAPALKPFIWLHVSVLREYLAAELQVPDQPFKFDLERAIDDWVFMCFFVGNDFLPHLPSLEIRENGIDTLIAIWRDNLPLMNGYLTKDGTVDLVKAQVILEGLAKQEDAIFRRRKQVEDRREANNKRRKVEQDRGGRQGRGNHGATNTGIQKTPLGEKQNAKKIEDVYADIPLFNPGETRKESKSITHDMVSNRSAVFRANLANKSAAAALKSKILSDSASDEINDKLGCCNDPSITADRKRKAGMIEEIDSAEPVVNTPQTNTPKSKPISDDTPPDTVRLWEEGYADRYYEQKFGVDPTDKEFRHKVARAYVEGLAWVLLYYFQGCPSWDWYYPYHYAPFAADFDSISNEKISFEKGRIFRPFEQLMGVLPAGSKQAIPKEFHHLMTSPDSEIVDFYPEDFTVDLNGKKWAWQGVALLPFIDSQRLLDAMAKVYPSLPPDVAARNAVGKDALLFAEAHQSLYSEVVKNFYSKKQTSRTIDLNSRISHGLTGKVEKNDTYLPHSSLSFPLSNGGMPSLEDDHSIVVYYEMPKTKFTHKSMLLRGVKIPAPKLTHNEIEMTRGKAARSGRSYGGAPLVGEGRGRSQFHNNKQNKQQPRNTNQQNGPPNNYGGNFSFAVPNPGWQPPPPGLTTFASLPPPLPTLLGAYGYNGNAQMPPVYPLPPSYGFAANTNMHGFIPSSNGQRGGDTGRPSSNSRDCQQYR
ncbi:Bgt-3134 [Blumeria graminis f. sp. tritici]|uniref:5'-3' exoribonuclease n=2 Tax=Blumeria graminis f. sp. tritici TaxID=62690 RepID=A0A9X9MHQ0_BLUGR|nr:Nuclear 5' to 3' single-stranded RNA exonuclease [Blumeria graminis f. sp. tritici 96224]VDB88345.1 Bgt-3134 [Blumeria graminis f. sp. tritici]